MQVLHQVSTLLGLSIIPRSGKPISPTCIPLMDVKLLGRFIQIFLIHLHLWFVANYPKCYGRHEWSCLWIKSFLQRLMSCKACCIYEAIFRATFWRIYLDTLDSVLTRSRYFFVDVWGRERDRNGVNVTPSNAMLHCEIFVIMCHVSESSNVMLLSQLHLWSLMARSSSVCDSFFRKYRYFMLLTTFLKW